MRASKAAIAAVVAAALHTGVAAAATQPDRQITWGGGAQDVPMVADVDGDGIDDVAYWNPKDGSWHMLTSSSGYDPDRALAVTLGRSGDRPLLGDVDGDGKADPIAARPQEHIALVHESGAGPDAAPRTIQWPSLDSGDRLLLGDADGDGRADITGYRPSNGLWRIMTSRSGFQEPMIMSTNWGIAEDVTFLEDIDGDGKGDPMAYRPSTHGWYAEHSESGLPFHRMVFPDRSETSSHAYAPDIVKQGSTYYAFECDDPAGGWSPRNTDAIKLTTSTDGGWTWSTPVIKAHPHVSKDTVTGLDRNFAYCDPSVVHYHGWYYLYNSNTFQSDAAGRIQTYITVSRSHEIDGDYLTYTERGTWESNPPDAKALVMPKLIRQSDPVGYGAGEQSVIMNDGKLVMFYVDDSLDPQPFDFNVWCAPIWKMESSDPVSWDTDTAVATNACAHSPAIKWDDERDRYVLAWIKSEHSPNAHMVAQYSSDGVTWTDPVDVFSAGAEQPDFSHNLGFEGDKHGHVVPGERPLVAFGVIGDLSNWFGPPWELWGTRADILSGSPPPATLARNPVFGGSASAVPLMGDLDGDGRADLVQFEPGDGSWKASVTSHGETGSTDLVAETEGAGERPFLGRFDGDARDDLVTYRAADGRWTITDGASALHTP